MNSKILKRINDISAAMIEGFPENMESLELKVIVSKNRQVFFSMVESGNVFDIKFKGGNSDEIEER